MLITRGSSMSSTANRARELGSQVSSTTAVMWWGLVVLGASEIHAEPWSTSAFQRVATAVADSPRMRPASVQLTRGASCKRWIRLRSTSSSGRPIPPR